MKKLNVFCGAVAAALFSVSAYADFKIGTLDMQKVFASPNGVEKIQKQLEDEFSGQRTEVIGMMRKLQSDQKDLEKNRSVMSKSKLDKKEADLKDEEEKFQSAQTSYQQAIMAAQKKAMENFLTMVKNASETVAGKEHLDAVLVNNTVMYAKSSQDVTDKVLARISK